ncbi:hypothetical protein AX16_010769 [Volvariella volvacea WC 439]|nr:hypothetical protein AX16_010769 [Volvariella volvacea WC 439]
MKNTDNNLGLCVHKSEHSKLISQLLSQLSESDSEDEGPHTLHTSQIDATPWQAGFNKYLNMSFDLGTMTIVEFWGDIVKALQFLKCTMRKDLLFWEVKMTQAELEERKEDGSVAEEGWNEFLDDDALLSDVGENDSDVDMSP